MSYEVCLHAFELDSQQAVPDLQLFSLLYSSTKHMHAAASGEYDGASRLVFAMTADSGGMVMQLAGSLYACEQGQPAGGRPAAAAAACAGVAHSSSNASSSGASRTASAAVSTERLALMLMARGAVAAGEVLAALAACMAATPAAQLAAHAAEVSPDTDEQIMHFLFSVLQPCLGCVRMLQASLTTCDLPGDAVRDSMQQKLLRDVQKLHDEAMNAQVMLHWRSTAAGSSAASSSSSSGSSGYVIPAAFTALLPSLSQRLVACGEALAALCPVPLCCNNPSCTELRGASEPQLVAGKGSVCSRCR
jgi:hypothetical protein